MEEGHPPGRALTQTELAWRRSAARYQLATTAVNGLRLAVAIAAAWIPLQPVREIADTLAGKETTVSGSLTVAISFSLALAGVGVVMLLKMMRQSKELIRLRERLRVYEQSLLGPEEGRTQ